MAVAWTLAWPGVTGPIVGARSPEQVDGWVQAAALALAPADLEEIAGGPGTHPRGRRPGEARISDRGTPGMSIDTRLDQALDADMNHVEIATKAGKTDGFYVNERTKYLKGNAKLSLSASPPAP